MKYSLKLKRAGLLAALCLAFSSLAPAPAFAGAVGSVGSWTTSPNSLPTAQAASASAVYNGYVYTFGGYTGSASSAVYYAKLNSNGSVGSWTTSSNPLPQGLQAGAAVAHNGYVYVMGGVDGSLNRLATVYYAPLNSSNGSVGSWTASSNSLPQGLSGLAATTYGGYVYVLGGFNVSNKSAVYYAKLNSNGSVGSWTTSSNPLPQALSAVGAVAENGYVYAIGGDNSSYAATDAVYYAKLNTDGSVGSWMASPNSLPHAADSLMVAASGGYVYASGGFSMASTYSSVFYAKFNSDGSIGSWITSPNALPQAEYGASAVAYNNYLYMLGGTSIFTGPYDSVYYAPLTPAVTTAQSTNAGTGKAVAAGTDFGTNITCLNPVTATSLANQDSGYDYPLGLMNLCFTTDAASNQVTLIFVTDLTPSQVVARDYNATTQTYSNVPGAVVTQTTYAGLPALQVTYPIADNGPLDSDNTVGSIDDPVGLAVARVNSAAAHNPVAPNTGNGIPADSSLAAKRIAIVGMVLIASGTVLVRRRTD